MNKGIAMALIAGGITVLVFGINASDSFGSDVSRFFNGAPTNKAIWLLLGGIGATAVGTVTLFRSRNS